MLCRVPLLVQVSAWSLVALLLLLQAWEVELFKIVQEQVLAVLVFLYPLVLELQLESSNLEVLVLVLVLAQAVKALNQDI